MKLVNAISLGVFLCLTTMHFSIAEDAVPPNPPVIQKKPVKKNRLKKKISEKMKMPVQELKKVTQPVGKAMTKTAATAVQEAKTVAKEAHSFGGRFLQGLINIMIAASPGKTRVYLPAPSSDPNSGVTVGVLPVFLFVDDKEQIRHILAPSMTYNRLFKLNTTMRYYWYPRKDAQLFSIGSYALETNRRFTLRYEDPSFYLDWLYFKFDFTTLRDGSYRFFGFGPSSRFEDRSNYTLRDTHVNVSAGINFLEQMRFIVTHRFRFANVVDGPIDSLPKISVFSPHPAGVDDPQTIMVQRFDLLYDSREMPVTPVRGHFFNVFGEMAGRIGGDSKFDRIGADLRGLYPFVDHKYVTGWRFAMEGENDGENVPLYERSLLGGKDSLRGFGDARFVDRGKINISLEERIRLYTLKAFNVSIDFEVTPFYETGTVFHDADKISFADLHHVGGVGFRSVVRPNVVGIIDLGFGDEGSTIFVGIDYPF